MKLSFLIFGTLALFLSSCGKQKIEPPCIQDQVIDFQDGNACNEGASVKEYKFQGELVYAFDPGICGADRTTEVVDYQCNTIGFLGGFAGNTAINGENFYQKAKFERTLFEN